MAETKLTEPECESDEDCEVYFLKPVNEYNIVDKIKEANKQLFDETFVHTADDGFAEDVCNAGDDCDGAGPSRKVTFAPNLEIYEPDSGIGVDTLELKREFEACVAEAKELERKLSTIIECDQITEENKNESKELSATELEKTCEAKQSALSTTTPSSLKTNDDIVEEICEEIIVMDMESEKSINTSPTALKSSAQAHSQRRMIKLRTFDFAEQDPPQTPEHEQDNKSLINLLTSDGEEECCSASTFDINVDNSDLDVDDIEADISSTDATQNSNAGHPDAETLGDDDDEEDDDLSLIVASYLPDDFDSKRLERPTSGRTKANNGKSRRLLVPFGNRFSFRRNAKPLPRNSIGTAISGNRVHHPPPEVTDLKFNYRICCEYRQHLAQPEKLPKYTGYLSEYGLTREQLERREEQLKRKQRYVLEHALQANETEIRKMQDNERAFTTWLRNKMRYPINKTRNMFDVKRRSLGSGANVAADNNTIRNNSGKVK